MLTSELLSVIDEYVREVITLEQLEDWLAARWLLLFRLPPSEPEATDLAAAVELGLAEMSNGSRSEDEFRSLLGDLLKQARTVSLDYPAQGSLTYAEASNQASPTIVCAPMELVSSHS